MTIRRQRAASHGNVWLRREPAPVPGSPVIGDYASRVLDVLDVIPPGAVIS